MRQENERYNQGECIDDSGKTGTGVRGELINAGQIHGQ